MKGFKRVMRGIALSLAVSLAVTAMPSYVQAEEATNSVAIGAEDFLEAEGKNLVNQNGEIINLRGTNASGYLVQEFWMTPTEYSTVTDQTGLMVKLAERFGEEEMYNLVDIYETAYWTEADFDNCVAMGMNCIRLPFWWRNLVDENGEFYGYTASEEGVVDTVSGNDVSGNDVSGNGISVATDTSTDPYAIAFERMDWFVREAGERGLYVILDMHGAPGSQNGSDHSGLDGLDAKEAASEFFFGENAAANQELFYDIWEVIAERYKDNPVVAGYDLLNEPYCTYRYNSKLTADELHDLLWNIYDKAYDVIRAKDPDHVIIMEATWDPVDLPHPAQYGWENIMYEYHNYLYDDYDNNNGQQIANMETKVNAIANADYNVPSYLGEFNYFNNIDAWDQGLELLTNAGINWTTWGYKTRQSCGNWGLYHHPVSMNTGVTVESSSYDEILACWQNVGTDKATPNSALIEVFSKWCKAEAVDNTLSPKYAEIENGDYYLVGNNTMKVLTNDESTSLIAATADANALAGGELKPFTLLNNDDGTVSLKAANGNYISVSTADNKMYATATAAGDTEKFYALVVSPTLVAFKSVATDTYVKVVDAEDVESLDVLVQSYSITGDESFQLYDKELDLLGSVKLPTYSGWSRYESEDTAVATIVGGSVASDVAEYSNGSAAGSMENSVAADAVADDWSNIKYVVYTVDAPVDGEYLISLNYNGSDYSAKDILVKANDGESQVVNLPAGEQWYSLYEEVVAVDLVQGENKIYISGILNSTGWANYDCIDVINAPLGENDVYTRYEAENYYTNATVNTQGHFSGGLGVENVNSDTKVEDVAFNWANIKYVDFTIYAEQAGEYTVVWGYTGADANGMTALYRLNDGENQVITLDNAGGNWNIPSTCTFNVNLEEGFNSLMLSGTLIDSGKYYANIDYIDVKLSSVADSPKEPDGASGWSHFEAENATIGGNAAVTWQDFFSMGTAVGSLNIDNMTLADVAEDWSNINYVAFTVDAPRAGDYRVKMAYNGNDDKVGLVKVNDGTAQELSIPRKGDYDWNVMLEQLFTVTLEEGENTLYISGAIGGGWYDIDYIEVCNSEITVIDEATQTERYEAEFYNTKSGNNPAVEVQNSEYLTYSGPNNEGVGGMGTMTTFTVGDNILGSGLNYTIFTVYAEQAGEYKVKLAGNGGSGETVGVYQVNENPSQNYDVLNPGGEWNTLFYPEFTVTLEEGLNQLIISGPYDDWNHWMNFDYIDVTPVNPVVEEPVEPGEVTVELQVGTGAPEVTLSDAEAVKEMFVSGLSEEEKARMEAGEDIKMILAVEALDTPPADDKTLIESEASASNKTVVQYLDITLLKQIGDGEAEAVVATDAPVNIAITIPADYVKEGYVFSVMYVHEGVFGCLEDTDAVAETITVAVDKFSTYALAYEDTTDDGGDGGEGDDNEGSDKVPSLSEVIDTIFGKETGSIINKQLKKCMAIGKWLLNMISKH